MVQTLMAELRVLIGKRAPPGGPPAAPLRPTSPHQHQYTRKDLKANLHRHMSIVLDRSFRCETFNYEKFLLRGEVVQCFVTPASAA
ncbi:unnamed protein product [Euphydryas editha]|uniref:Uncharacterized protein n=1 Tax=Euphydryas editha TaxID=104508 RepID=A0AAU9UUL4_EUPED|nr:unnamed protein product [Euphydryas editha]